MAVSAERVSVVTDRPVRADGGYVLYWMTAARRAKDSFALDHALDRARELRRPLLVLEALRRGYPWAAPRHHRFVVEGMAANRTAFGAAGVTYLPYVERSDGEGRGLLAALAAGACLVVTDRSPAFFLPRMLAAAARVPARLEAVDGVGLLPLAATTKAWPSAVTFRRHFQRSWPSRIDAPRETPDWTGGPRAALPAAVAERWRSAHDLLDAPARADALVSGPGAVGARGGGPAGDEVLERFVAHRLARYGDRSHPDAEAASGLSPWLHFGHVSAHAVFRAALRDTGWTPDRLGEATGAREGFWGLDPAREAFLDELVTWRELAHTFSALVPDAESYATLPAWARATLGAHATDLRPHAYDLDRLEAADTHDELWNAAQRQLTRDGVLHNYLRMLWAKKILEWSPSPEEAFARVVTLNHRYALDGRDPNSTAGISWSFGRFDRPWFPERPVFGTIRFLSSDQARRKLRLRGFLARYGSAPPPRADLKLPFG